MPEIIVTLSQTEYDAMTVMTITPEEWLQHAAKNKARKLINVLVRDNSDKQPEKITDGEKETIIDGIDLVKERDKRKGLSVA